MAASLDHLHSLKRANQYDTLPGLCILYHIEFWYFSLRTTKGQQQVDRNP